MSGFRTLSMFVAILAMGMSFAASAGAAPPAAQVQPLLESPATQEFLVDFPLGSSWSATFLGDQDGRYLAVFRVQPSPASVRVMFGVVEASAEALVQEQVMLAMREGFSSVGTIRSVDGRLVSVRLFRAHDDESGIVDEAVVAARVSPDDPGTGILFIAQRSGPHDNTLASQVQHALLHTTFTAK